MGGLDLIKTFREVAAKRSFSQAAISLEVSKATVSKHVAELERRSGVRLLNRTTRALSLTDAGVLLPEKSTALVNLRNRHWLNCRNVANARRAVCASPPHTDS